MADVMISLPEGYTGTVQITFAPGIAHPKLTQQEAPPGKWPAKVEDLLGRYENHEPSYPHRQLAEEMLDLGFTPLPPEKRGGGESAKTYLRWTYKGSKRRVSMYQDTGGLTVDSRPIYDFVSKLPGAHPVKGKHDKVNFHHDDSVEVVLAAAKSVRDYSNGN
jgi:hypothetical protein